VGLVDGKERRDPLPEGLRQVVVRTDLKERLGVVSVGEEFA